MLTLNVFKKERATKEGRMFNAYITRIVNKATGEEITAGLKFEDGVDVPKEFPVRIDILNGSVSPKKYKDETTGEEKTGWTVWVRDWKVSEEVYEDKSLDDWA